MTNLQQQFQSERVLFSVSSPSGVWSCVGIQWTSNDPDESTGTIGVYPSNAGEGSLHPDFALLCF